MNLNESTELKEQRTDGAPAAVSMKALPAYEQVCKASHSFNLLDARRAISVTERQRYILRVRTIARAVAEAYVAKREKLRADKEAAHV